MTARGGRGRGGAARGRRARAHRRGDPRRRHGDQRRGRGGHEHAERGAAAGDAALWMPVLSGTANAGAPFDVRADRPAAESAYAALVRLVERAQGERAPLVRMADRYAGMFLPVTLRCRGAGVGTQRRSGPRSRGRRGRHPVPADPGGADRARLRAVARRPQRRDRQGSRARSRRSAGAHRAVRQDRHADRRHARRAESHRVGGTAPARCCVSRPRSTGCRRTSSARRWCAPPARRGCS